MILLWVLLSIIAGDISVQAQQSSIIETSPSLPNNTIVTGYEGLQLTAQIQSGMYEQCRWYYGNIFAADMFRQVFPCNDNDGSGYTLSCDLTDNVITSTWTILLPTSESVTIRVECRLTITQPEVVKGSVYLDVTDCSTIAPLVVNSRSATYNSSGTFSCTNDGTLFYSNGTQLTSTQTTCLATAEWSGQNGLECWKAPSNVNITGSLTVLEGHNVRLTCSYTKGIPVMTNISFNVNNEEIKGQEYVATLKRSDNKKPVYCQANNRFTETLQENANDGRSPTYSFNVLYAPFQNTSNVCYLFSETDQDNKDCEVVFYSNPNATFVAVIDATSGNEVENSSNEITIDGTSGKHTYKFTGIEITSISSSTYYALNVSSLVPPTNLDVDNIPQGFVFIHSIPFTVNINIPITTTVTIPITTPDDGGNKFIIDIVVVVLSVVVVILFIALCIVCWRRRLKDSSSSSSKRQTTGRAVRSSASANVQQRAMRRDDPDYLSLDDPNESKSAYEQIDGYENVIIKPSTSKHQVDEGEYVNVSTTPYINLNLTKQQVDEVEYVNVSTTPYINVNLAKTSFTSKPESEYEMMNPHVVTKK